MNKVCDKHKKSPVFIYHSCIGCELESLRARPAAGTPAPAAAAHLVEWTWKDTLEYVRKDFLSCEVYEKLRDGGSIEFNKRQLTNLLNGAFEYYATTNPLPPVASVVAPPATSSPDTPLDDDSLAVTGVTDPRNAVILAWWAGKRPFGWSEEEHLDDPTAYCTGAEKPLALLAVELAKAART